MKRLLSVLFASFFGATLSFATVGCNRGDAPESEDAVFQVAAPAPNSVDYSSANPIALPFLNSNAEYKEFIASAPIAVVKFGATWCGPCRAFSPELEKQAGFFAERGVQFAEIDVDQMENLALSLNVSSIPDVRVYLDGREYARVVGFEPRRLANLIESVCADAAEPSPKGESEGKPTDAVAPQESEVETPLEDELWPNE